MTPCDLEIVTIAQSWYIGDILPSGTIWQILKTLALIGFFSEWYQQGFTHTVFSRILVHGSITKFWLMRRLHKFVKVLFYIAM